MLGGASAGVPQDPSGQASGTRAVNEDRLRPRDLETCAHTELTPVVTLDSSEELRPRLRVEVEAADHASRAAWRAARRSASSANTSSPGTICTSLLTISSTREPISAVHDSSTDSWPPTSKKLRRAQRHAIRLRASADSRTESSAFDVRKERHVRSAPRWPCPLGRDDAHRALRLLAKSVTTGALRILADSLRTRALESGPHMALSCANTTNQ